MGASNIDIHSQNRSFLRLNSVKELLIVYYLCVATLIRNLPRYLVSTYRMLDRSLAKSKEGPYKCQWNRNTKPKGE